MTAEYKIADHSVVYHVVWIINFVDLLAIQALAQISHELHRPVDQSYVFGRHGDKEEKRHPSPLKYIWQLQPHCHGHVDHIYIYHMSYSNESFFTRINNFKKYSTDMEKTDRTM